MLQNIQQQQTNKEISRLVRYRTTGICNNQPNSSSAGFTGLCSLQFISNESNMLPALWNINYKAFFEIDRLINLFSGWYSLPSTYQTKKTTYPQNSIRLLVEIFNGWEIGRFLLWNVHLRIYSLVNCKIW